MRPVTRLLCLLLALTFLAAGCSYARCPTTACPTGVTTCPTAATSAAVGTAQYYPDRRGGCPPIAAGTTRVIPLEGAAIVRMTENDRFEPAQITIQTGQTVQWINNTREVHTVVADPALAANPANVQLPAGAPPFNSGKIEPGRSYVYTFSVPEMYRYFCVPHEAEGMVGTIVVQ